MPTANQFIADNLAILVMAGIVLVLLTLIIIALLLRKGRTMRLDMTYTIAPFVTALNEQFTQIKQAAEHHADVSAVVTMVRQLDEMDEDANKLLQSYPETVRAAAWLHYINRLGSDLQAAQQRLSDAHQGKGAFGGYSAQGLITMQQNCQQHVDDLRAKLDKAIELSGQSGLHAV